MMRCHHLRWLLAHPVFSLEKQLCQCDGLLFLLRDCLSEHAALPCNNTDDARCVDKPAIESLDRSVSFVAASVLARFCPTQRAQAPRTAVLHSRTT